MNIVVMNTEEALRLRVVTKQKTTTTEIIRCSRSGLVSSEQSTITLQPFEVVVQNEAQKNLKQIFFCLLSHIFLKKVFWDTGNKWIFLQTEHGVGVVGGFWEEFTASAALSSMKERTSIHFISFFFPPVINSLQVLWLSPPAIWQFYGAAQHI